MIGDDRGWDPGSRALPISLGFLMLGLSLYLSYWESRGSRDSSTVHKGPLKLILLTISLCVLYILCFRAVGFVLATCILLFTLIYFNYEQDVRWERIPRFLAGLVCSVLLTLSVYSAGRVIIRSLFFFGRNSGLVFLSSRLFSSAVVLIFMVVLYLALKFFLGRTMRNPDTRTLMISGLTATGLTELLYLIFKQIFFISLTQGLIIW